MKTEPLPGKPTEPGLYLQTWAGRTAKVRVYNAGDRLVWAIVGNEWPHEMDVIDGETWTPILELPQTEVITWNEGMPPDGEIVLALFRGDEGVTLAKADRLIGPNDAELSKTPIGMIKSKQPLDMESRIEFPIDPWEDADPSALICWALPKGPR